MRRDVLKQRHAFRVNDRHRVGVTASGVRFATPVWTNKLHDQSDLYGQVSMRAVDEWIVRDGIVIVMGLDYSRFIGAGGAHSITPRFGVQFDANARTRVKAAFASGWRRRRHSECCDFRRRTGCFP